MILRSHRKLLILLTGSCIIAFLFCSGIFYRLLTIASPYPGAVSLGDSERVFRLGAIWIEHYQFSHYVSEDPYSSILPLLIEDDWIIYTLSHEKWYRLIKEERIWSYPRINLFHSIDVQPTNKDATCITYYLSMSLSFVNGQAIYTSDNYNLVTDHIHFAPECPLLNANP